MAWDGFATTVKVARRVALAAVVVGTLVWLAGWGVPDVCSQQLPTASSTPVEVCQPMSATDPRALLLLLVVGLLLLPELTELELGGVIKVRRQLDEVKGEASELKNEMAHIRTQVLTAATAAAAANANASVVTNVYPERTTDVGRALTEVDGDGDGDFDEGELQGAYAVVAFDAGFYGLTRYLSDGMAPAVVAGYAFNEDDELELYSLVTHGDGAQELATAQRAAAVPDLSGIYYVGTKASGYVLTAPACDDEGLVVGALSVRLPGSAETLDEADDEDTVGTVELMANAYARLLIDILGEKPRGQPAGKSTVEGTQ